MRRLDRPFFVCKGPPSQQRDTLILMKMFTTVLLILFFSNSYALCVAIQCKAPAVSYYTLTPYGGAVCKYHKDHQSLVIEVHTLNQPDVQKKLISVKNPKVTCRVSCIKAEPNDKACIDEQAPLTVRHTGSQLIKHNASDFKQINKGCATMTVTMNDFVQLTLPTEADDNNQDETFIFNMQPCKTNKTISNSANPSAAQ